MRCPWVASMTAMARPPVKKAREGEDLPVVIAEIEVDRSRDEHRDRQVDREDGGQCWPRREWRGIARKITSDAGASARRRLLSAGCFKLARLWPRRAEYATAEACTPTAFPVSPPRADIAGDAKAIFTLGR